MFPMIVGTEIWPNSDEWKDKILLIETSEEKPKPDYVLYYLRNLGAVSYTHLDILDGSVVLKNKKVAVIGSGMTGLETSEMLAENGNDKMCIRDRNFFVPKATWTDFIRRDNNEKAHFYRCRCCDNYPVYF